MIGNLLIILFNIFIRIVEGQVRESPQYSCGTNANSVKFTLSRSFHSAWNSNSNCYLPRCNASSGGSYNCRSAYTPCYIYRTSNEQGFCAPGILCSILESCDTSGRFTCALNNHICIIDSCCSPRAVCVPWTWQLLCQTEFSNASQIYLARYGHRSAILPNGKVLVTGGYNKGSSLNSTEIFDPSTNTWKKENGMNSPRLWHTVSVLLNGKVLVCGGRFNSFYLNSAELYDPTTREWSKVNNMKYRRSLHTASILSNGKVLVVGGTDIYMFNAPFNNSWKDTHKYISDQYHAIDSGVRMISVGKQTSISEILGIYSSHTELYDPVKETWELTDSLNFEREYHTASVLFDGAVLVAGGRNMSVVFNSAELYNPSTGIWTLTSNMNVDRYAHTASVLTNGKVLIAGGYHNNYATNHAELYDSITGIWTVTGSMNIQRSDHTATVLPDGKVLVTGGGISQAALDAEVYDPTTQLWTVIGHMKKRRIWHSASLLKNGKTLIIGGTDGEKIENTVEIY